MASAHETCEAWRRHDEDRGSGRVGVVAAPAERSSRVDLSIQTEVEVTYARVKGGTEVLLEHRG